MSDDTRAEKNKTMVLAGLLIVAVIAALAIIFLTSRPDPGPGQSGINASAPPAAAPADQSQRHRRLREAVLRRQAGPPPKVPALTPMPKEPVGRRVAFAKVMNDRFTGRELKVRVATLGDQNTILRLSWPAKAADQKHIDSIKTAAPLYAELRSNGFKKIEIVVGEETIWSKDL